MYHFTYTYSNELNLEHVILALTHKEFKVFYLFSFLHLFIIALVSSRYKEITEYIALSGAGSPSFKDNWYKESMERFAQFKLNLFKQTLLLLQNFELRVIRQKFCVPRLQLFLCHPDKNKP